ncbi:MAG: POTRA domain-containing protein, partial [Flavobacteriales bacterium]|nr:POTRA domain-containing protein [Flavobacteriales bacterium]
MRKLLFSVLLSIASCATIAQVQKLGEMVDYATPRDYTIASIAVTGAQYTDVQAIKLFSGLQIGQEIAVPGEQVAKAIRNLWRQQLFADVTIYAAETRGEQIYLVIDVVEMPRLSKYKFPGLKRSERENLREEIDLIKGRIVTENLVTNTSNKILDYYIDKGFFNATVDIVQVDDPGMENSVELQINVDRGERVKISEINYYGASQLEERKLKRAFKETKEKRWWRVFKSSKFIEENYETDKNTIIAKYNQAGYRNAIVVKDSVYKTSESTIGIDVYVEEGEQFFFRNITFAGNTKYRSTQLDSILKIQAGDIYNREVLETRLYGN